MATLRDIEKMTGVSLATISRILNGNPGVSKEKREIVLAAMKEVGYVAPERSYSRRRVKKVIVVLTSNYGFWGEMYDGIVTTAREMGYTVLIHYNPRELGKFDMSFFEEDVLSRDHDIAGVIITNMEIEHEEYQKLRERLPVVFCGQYYGFKGACSVSTNDVEASMELTEHLIETGRKNVGVMYIKVNDRAENVTTLQDDRLLGYKRALEKHNIPFDESKQWSVELERPVSEIANEILATNPRIDAMFCMHAFMALDLELELLSRGVNVPEDIAIAGYDAEYYLHGLFPEITSVKQHFREFGVESVKMLDSMAAGQMTSGKKTYIDHEIVIKQSTAVDKK